MDARQLPSRAGLKQLEGLAQDLVAACNSGDADALRRFAEYFELGGVPAREELRAMAGHRLDKLGRAAARSAELALADAQLLVADRHGFESWDALAQHLAATGEERSPATRFEAAVDAVVAGDIATLESLLRADPGLARARSGRKHRSTLLHYVSANGVEDFRQKTPPNAVEVAKLLLAAGAEVDAENDPGRGTTLGLVATSVHPLVAGVQNALLETLLDAGAAVDGAPGGWNPLIAALQNGRGEAAAYLAGRGARLDLEGAAGVGRLDVVKSLFANATNEQVKAGFTWACEYGRTGVVEFLLQRGAAIDARLVHDGQTGLHWAALGGHLDTSRLLLARGASVNARDRSYDGTPLGWALYGWCGRPAALRSQGYYEVVALLVGAGATVDPAWLNEEDRGMPLGTMVRTDPRMRAALGRALPHRG